MQRRHPRGARGPRIDAWAVRSRRIHAGLTQNDLAERSGIDRSHLSRIESGGRLYPAPRITQALADALGVSIGDLLASDFAEVPA